MNVLYFARIIALDGASYMAVDGGFTFAGGKRIFEAKFDNKLPAYAIVNLNMGTNFDIFGLNTTASLQILNALDNEYFADADRFGAIPGLGRAFRVNISAAL